MPSTLASHPLSALGLPTPETAPTGPEPSPLEAIAAGAFASITSLRTNSPLVHRGRWAGWTC